MDHHPWSRTIAMISGRLRPLVPAWPSTLTTIARRHRPSPCAGLELTAQEQDALQAIFKRPLSAGELAFVLGAKLETAHALIASLKIMGMIAEKRRSWECTSKGRRAAEDARKAEC